jgi:hypothetical protein
VATWPEFDPRALMRALTGRGVDFVVVGGFAAVIHGSPRLTQDLDVTYADDEANLRALGEALQDLEARLRDVEDDLPFVPDERALRRVEILTLDTSAGPLDLILHPPGAAAYAALRRRAQRVDVGGLAVLVASIDDLLAMKRAAGRAKDLADVEELEALGRLSGAQSKRSS